MLLAMQCSAALTHLTLYLMGTRPAAAKARKARRKRGGSFPTKAKGEGGLGFAAKKGSERKAVSKHQKLNAGEV
jgi:hypothetical protein